MNNKNKKNCRVLLILLAVIFGTIFLIACLPTETTETTPTHTPEPVFLSQLRVEGTQVLNKEDEYVMLRGINVGGLLVTEQWMCMIGGSRGAGDAVDHYYINRVFVERFGTYATQAIWENYRNHFWTEQDFINVREMGVNVLRLPFTYMTVDPLYHNIPAIPGQRFNFSFLDWFVARAAYHGIYTILNLHGAYGSHNGQDHSGRNINVPAASNNVNGVMNYVTFFNPTHPDGIYNRARTTVLWRAVAEHFNGNPNVAAFFLLNEPGEKANLTVRRHWDYHDELYRAIREVNQDHIIIFNSSWGGADIPHPTNNAWGFNWDRNVMYAFHHYTHYAGHPQNPNYGHTHNASMRNRVTEVHNRNFGVPIIMSEFTSLFGEASWEYTLELFDEFGWHWTPWTYRVRSGVGGSVWGVFNSRVQTGNSEAAQAAQAYRFVRADTDSFEEIMRKWSMVGGDQDNVYKFAFPSGRTLFDLLQYYMTRETVV